MTKGPDLSDFTHEEIILALKDVRHPIDVAVFDSTNYFNLGAIIRTSHNFLVKNIYAVDLTDFYPKAAMAARHWEPVIKLTSEEFFKTVSGRSLVAFERRPNLVSESLYGFSWPDNPIAMFGGEKCGFADDILSKCNHTISVPVYGLQNDNNVSSIAAIALYDWAQKYYTRNIK